MKPQPFNFEDYLSENCKSTRSSFLREILETAEMSDIISFAGGLPNPGLFPVNEIKWALDKVMTENARCALQYAGSQGYRPLREWICNRYYERFGIHIDPGNIIITNGSQQALDLSGKLFINPGDCVVMEKPSYIGAIQAFSAYNARMEQVTLQHDGINIDEFSEKTRSLMPKLCYCIPNYQNPSGISYSSQKRHQFAEMISDKKLIVLEDDPYGEIYFDNSGHIPISFLIPDQCILTGSFSKMISPGIRAGWMVVNEKIKSHFLKAKQAADLHTNNIVQQMIYTFLTCFNIDDHLDKIRGHYLRQKNNLIETAKKYLPEGTKFTNPDGGMFVWATLPDDYDTMQLVDFAMREKVIFVPGKTFFVSGEGNNTMRLNFTNSSLQETEEGMKRLNRALCKYRENLHVMAGL
ncbi:MAG: PLP-dependent aminotransferase family protein [Bacteroidales bacterium]|nr:PLP-dependent aminotransferase family protein [Bacteroidales bacterium]